MKNDGSRRSRFRPVAVARLHGRADAGSVRLSRLSRAGTVWTVDMETGEPYECDFAPASGSWLEAEDGERYALAAQAVGRDGSPSGRYLTVTRIEDDGVVPALRDVRLGDQCTRSSTAHLHPPSADLDPSASRWRNPRRTGHGSGVHLHRTGRRAQRYGRR